MVARRPWLREIIRQRSFPVGTPRAMPPVRLAPAEDFCAVISLMEKNPGECSFYILDSVGGKLDSGFRPVFRRF
jgi:hypothetical protein